MILVLGIVVGFVMGLIAGYAANNGEGQAAKTLRSDLASARLQLLAARRGLNKIAGGFVGDPTFEAQEALMVMDNPEALKELEN